MNMHHITKSLFVGVAIAGIGMSSGRAELQIEESSKDCARMIIKVYLNERYNMLRGCLPSELNLYIRDKAWDLTDYESDTTYETCEGEDVRRLFDSLFGEGGYLSHFEDAKDYLKVSDDDRRKNLKEFLEAEFSFEIHPYSALGRTLEDKKLNLMCFLKRVASRFDPEISFGSYYCYSSSFDDEVLKVLKCGGMIKESEQAGYYLPEWSFIFNNDFINEVTHLITGAVKKQINNK